jgi:hypothetical protein
MVVVKMSRVVVATDRARVALPSKQFFDDTLCDAVTMLQQIIAGSAVSSLSVPPTDHIVARLAVGAVTTKGSSVANEIC